MTDPSLSDMEKARQQVILWKQQGEQASMKRQFIHALRYYEQALELAEKVRLTDLQGSLCRDLAYVHLHHGSYRKALELLDRGLDLEVQNHEVMVGLLVNKSSVYLALRDFPMCRQHALTAKRYIEHNYPNLEKAPLHIAFSYSAIVRLDRDLSRVLDLIESGVNPERIEINVELAPPMWSAPS